MLVRSGLARLLSDAGVEVVGEAADAGDLLRMVALDQPDVAIVDIRMPPTHTDEGLIAARSIRERYRRRRSSCSASTSSLGTPSGCSLTSLAVSATCSRSASPTRPQSATRCAG
jgi:DNA-binding NarL/FixJ family response regulator